MDLPSPQAVSPFIEFCKEQRYAIISSFRTEHPQRSLEDATLEIHRRWRALSDHERAEFETRSEATRGQRTVEAWWVFSTGV